MRISGVFVGALAFFLWLLPPPAALAVGNGPSDVTLPVFSTVPDQVLESLVREMGKRRVVLLGDGTHGTEEFYTLRKRITRKLIAEYGFRGVVLEAEWDSCQLVNRYLQGDPAYAARPRRLLADAFARWPAWVWANEEMVELIQWLRLFNDSIFPGNAKVALSGMDMQLAIGPTLELVQKEAPEAMQNRLMALVSWWQPYLKEPLTYRQAWLDGRETGNLMASELLLRSSPGNSELLRGLRLLVAAEEYYRVMGNDRYRAWNVRSKHFADHCLERLQAEDIGRGMVIWAHNSHVGDMRSSAPDSEGLVNLGQLLRQVLGEQLFILGATSFQGTVLAADGWGLPVTEKTVPPARDDSIEAALASGDWAQALLYWPDQVSKQSWSTYRFGHRGIGVSYLPAAENPDNYVLCQLPARYDALWFFRYSRALRPLLPW